MATQEQIAMLLEELEKAAPYEQFKSIDKNTAGVRAILKYLNETEETVTAGKISRYMNVSTARVAVLLKKMVANGLIEKTDDPEDARIVVVRLSEHGVKTAEKVRESIHAQVGAMIDKVGMERMLEYVAISNEIRSVMKVPDINLRF